jgi:hypothetical protein
MVSEQLLEEYHLHKFEGRPWRLRADRTFAAGIRKGSDPCNKF